MENDFPCPLCNTYSPRQRITDFPNYVVCPNCGLGIRDIPPKEDSKTYTDDWVVLHATSIFVLRHQQNIIRNIKPLNVHGILDVGCASGKLVHMLNHSGYQADGIDNSIECIKYAKSHYTGNFSLADANFNTSEKRYDLVIASHVVEHLTDPQSLVRALSHNLKPLGYVYIAVPNFDYYNPESIWRRHGEGNIFDPINHTLCFNRCSLTRLLENNGFAIHTVKTKTYMPLILSGTASTIWNIHKGYKGIPQGKVRKDSIHTVFNTITMNRITEFLMAVPNKLSAVNGKGEELTIIATKE